MRQHDPRHADEADAVHARHVVPPARRRIGQQLRVADEGEGGEEALAGWGRGHGVVLVRSFPFEI